MTLIYSTESYLFDEDRRSEIQKLSDGIRAAAKALTRMFKDFVKALIPAIKSIWSFIDSIEKINQESAKALSIWEGEGGRVLRQ